MNQESATGQAWRKWIAGAAIGAMAMYLTDPERGRRRRALARDKMQSMWARTGDAIDVSSRDLSNRIHGMRTEASRKLFGPSFISDDQLLMERVRSKIGRAVSHPHAIKVTAQQGRIILSGPILAHEKEQLLSAVRAVPGVGAIEDALEVHETSDSVPSLQGQGKRRQLRPAILQENWPPALRALATVGGGALGYFGMKRRSPTSVMLAALGVGLMARGMVNMPLKRMIGADTEKLPIHLEDAIHIEAPRETVFDMWSNYENFPHFMSHVQKVQDLGNGRSHWVVNGPAGTVVEWDAQLTESKRPEVIAWRSEPNSIVQHEGRVRFDEVNGSTRVQVQMGYNPPAGVLGHAVASLFNGDPRKQMQEDLMRMKSFIETGIPPHDAAKPIREASTALH
jgi:uncharacterized membrane protein